MMNWGFEIVSMSVKFQRIRMSPSTKNFSPSVIAGIILLTSDRPVYRVSHDYHGTGDDELDLYVGEFIAVNKKSRNGIHLIP